MANFIKCPNCGKDIPDTSKKCFQCGKKVSISHPQPQQMQYQQPVQPQMMQPNMNVTNENLIQCPACFNYMGKLADTCPYCGTPRQKKVANPILLDALAVFALAFAVFAYMANQKGFASAVMVICWLIYGIYYCIIKDNKDIDSSKVKQSLITISILFLLTFGITFVITFR